MRRELMSLSVEVRGSARKKGDSLIEYHDYFQVAFHYMVLRHTTHGCRYFGTRPESRVLGLSLLIKEAVRAARRAGVAVKVSIRHGQPPTRAAGVPGQPAVVR